jgi:hypothetical protein
MGNYPIQAGTMNFAARYPDEWAKVKDVVDCQ